MTKLDVLGRLTIPKQIRTRMDLENKEFAFIEGENELIVKPLKSEYTISSDDMNFLRDLLELIETFEILDDVRLNYLRGICRLSDEECEICKKKMYLNNDNTYICKNCKK